MPSCPRCGENNPAQARFCSACGTALAPAAPDEERRKVVTILFSDLAGSTNLGEQLDPESLRRVMTRYFDTNSEILKRHGGTVEKFIGDAVMAVFGIPELHEDDALRAVRAGWELQGAVAELNNELDAEHGVKLQVRTGIHTGEVITGDPEAGQNLVTGDVVNVAARLEQAAPPGEILLGEMTYRLVRDAVEVEATEPLTLKGKSETVPAFRLSAVDMTAAGVLRRLDSPLVGRARELDGLVAAFDAAVTGGTSHMITILGQAGMGKSRLTAEFLAKVDQRASVVHGRCLPYGEGITYWPVAEIVRETAGITDDDEPRAAFAKVRATIGSEDPDGAVAERIAETIGLTEGISETQETFWAIRKYLEALARKEPLVAVFDDIHWAEPTLLDLLEYLNGWIKEVPVVLVCPARPELLEARPSWAVARPEATTLTLAPLDRDASDELISNLLNQVALPEELVERISAAAEGNALYLEELLRMLIDDGVVRPVDGRLEVAEIREITIPATIHSLLAARLDRLATDERGVVQRASVIGKSFWWGAVASLSGDEMRARLPSALQTLVRKEMIRPAASSFVGEDAFSFAHILVRDAAYDGLSKQLRAELHEAFAGWLESKAGERVMEFEEILGYHLEQAYRYQNELKPFDIKTEKIASEAAAHLGAAGRRAFARSDVHAAVNLLGRAVELLDESSSERAALSLELADALHEAGELGREGELLQQTEAAARRGGDRSSELRAAIKLAFLRMTTHPSEESQEAAERTATAAMPEFEKMGDDQGMMEAQLVIAERHFDEGHYRATKEPLESALAHAERSGDHRVEAKIMAHLASLLFWGPTPAEEGVARCEEILEKTKHDPVSAAKCRLFIAGLRAMRGDIEPARDLAREARSTLQEFGMARAAAGSSQISGMVEMLAGDLEGAEREYRSGDEALERIGDTSFRAASTALLARVLFDRGSFDEADELARLSEELSGDDESVKPDWGATRAKLLARQGAFEEAEQLARESVDIAASGEELKQHADAVRDLAIVLQMSGRTPEAVEVAAEAGRLYEEKGDLMSLDAVSRMLHEWGAAERGPE